MAKKKVSLRIRNFETTKMKVNDANSNPIEIAAVVVWKVVDTAEAMFEVDDYEHYVKVQSEAAVRGLATAYPYDAHNDGEEALSTHTDQVSKRMLTEVQERLGKAGVEATESRISHLAYSPEIASAMLQRQQASAIIAARQKIVEGAVGMVETALEMLSSKKILELDSERKATMVSNPLRLWGWRQTDYPRRCISGISSQVRPLYSRPFALFDLRLLSLPQVPHCLKKNAVPCFTH
jgi:hypothetical protein